MPRTKVAKPALTYPELYKQYLEAKESFDAAAAEHKRLTDPWPRAVPIPAIETARSDARTAFEAAKTKFFKVQDELAVLYFEQNHPGGIITRTRATVVDPISGERKVLLYSEPDEIVEVDMQGKYIYASAKHLEARAREYGWLVHQQDVKLDV